MKKLMSSLLAIMMLFSQLASPITVCADVLTLSTENSDYSFDIVPSVADEKVSINISNTDDILEDTEKYIVKVLVKFDKVLDDAVVSTLSDSKTLLLTGLELSDKKVEFEDIGKNFNGNYTALVDVYETDSSLVDTDEEDLNDYILDKTEIYSEELSNFASNEVKSTLDLEATSTNIVCSGNECTLDEGDIVTLSSTITVGDKSEEGLGISYYYYSINDELKLYSYNFNDEIDFSKLLNGVYDIKIHLMNSNDEEILSDNVVIDYENPSNTPDMNSYFQLDESMTEEDLLAKMISSTLLSDEEKEEINYDGDEVNDKVTKLPIDKAISDALSDALKTEVYADSYSIVNDEEVPTLYSRDFYGRILESDDYLPTVGELLTTLEPLGFNTKIVDKLNNIVDNDEYISTGMKLVVDAYSTELEYNILVYGDIDGGLVEDSEITTLIKTALGIDTLDGLYLKAGDFDKNGNIDIVDVSYVAGAVAIDCWVDFLESEDTISADLLRENADDLKIGDTFNVELYLSGFNSDYMNAISGILNFDKSILSLEGMTVNDILKDYTDINTDTNEFMFVGLDFLDEDSTIVTFTFKVLKEGNTDIYLSKLFGGMDGTKLEFVNESVLNVNIEREPSTNNDIVELKPSVGKLDKEFKKDIYEYTLYVPSETESVTLEGLLGDEYASTMGFKEYKLTDDVTVITIDVKSETGDVKTYKITVIKEGKGSISNNISQAASNVASNYYNTYLSKLEIKGYKIDFDKTKLDYEIKVKSSVKSLDITAIAEDSSSNVSIYGNDNFKTGDNTVKIIVSAEDGSERVYTIKAKKEAKKETVDVDDVNNNNVEKTIIIVLIILVVGGLLYLILKKDDEVVNIVGDKKDSKKNNK